MSNIIDYLQQLDLSEFEAKCYLKLLETGPISISELAETLKIKRTTAYVYIEPLINKGLATKLIKGTKKQIAPTEPENLEGLIEEKFTFANALKKQFPQALQEIKNAFPGFTEVTNFEIKYYKGVQNARKIYQEALRSNEVRGYVKIKETEKLFPENMPVFENAFKHNKNLKVWEIIYDSMSTTKDAEAVKSITERYYYKYMPNHLKLSSEDILIYEGKVSIINYRNAGTSVVLQSYDFYNNLKELFDFMWEVLS